MYSYLIICNCRTIIIRTICIFIYFLQTNYIKIKSIYIIDFEIDGINSINSEKEYMTFRDFAAPDDIFYSDKFVVKEKGAIVSSFSDHNQISTSLFPKAILVFVSIRGSLNKLFGKSLEETSITGYLLNIPIRIGSYNIKSLNYGKESLEDFNNDINGLDLDIICLQEVDRMKSICSLTKFI